jgi:hypothetical protein
MPHIRFAVKMVAILSRLCPCSTNVYFDNLGDVP